MKISKWALCLIALFLISKPAFSEDIESEFEDVESEIEKEIQSAQPNSIIDSTSEEELETDLDETDFKSEAEQKKEEEVVANENLKPIEKNQEVDLSDRNQNRFPPDQPLFVKPPGPKQGGKLRVPHPRAAEGLIRINRDGSYQYKTALKDKSATGTVKVSSMSAPSIDGGNSNTTYKSMYGSENLNGVAIDYEWQVLDSFGKVGLQLGSGIWFDSAKGSFKRNPSERSEERYSIFILPISAYLNYRFEYSRKQWIVPFVNAGGTYFGLAEIRDDGQTPAFAGAPAIGGGGGVMLSISRLDNQTAFTMSSEYGVADLWVIIEGRVLQGLNAQTDFTSQSINAGVAVDF